MNKNDDPILSGINMVIGERKDYNYTEPSKELEEEINNIADELFDKLLPQDGDFITEESFRECLETFANHIINWQKEQMYKLLGEQITLNYNEGYKKGTLDKEEQIKDEFIFMKEWFEQIAEKCKELTSDNVSHKGKDIREFAKKCAEYIETTIL